MTKEKEHRPGRWIGCPLEAEFLGEDRKRGKMQRKRASAGDRSKYKKTDRDKLQRQEKRQSKEFSKNPDLLRGRVLSITPQGIMVDYENKTICCFLKGVLKKEKGLLKNLVAVGDIVLFEAAADDEGVIVHVEPRHSTLSRADNLSQRKEQLIATNIDQVIITASVITPSLKPSLIDRYIIATLKGNMEPVVVVNKIDLLEDDTIDPQLLAQERELYEELLNAHKITGIPIIPLSVVTGEGIELLQKTMKDKASVFSGQSGVGKTSLINSIAGLELPIGDMVGKTKKGSHTTTRANLLRMPFGGWCVDTPGVKSFGIWDLNENEILPYFSEIYETGRGCKYPDCTHMNETECAVIKAVEKGKISFLRYQSYCQLIDSVRQEHLRR